MCLLLVSAHLADSDEVPNLAKTAYDGYYRQEAKMDWESLSPQMKLRWRHSSEAVLKAVDWPNRDKEPKVGEIWMVNSSQGPLEVELFEQDGRMYLAKFVNYWPKDVREPNKVIPLSKRYGEKLIIQQQRLLFGPRKDKSKEAK